MTLTAATCAANDGSITLEASGGTAPYQYSIYGTTFQEQPVFTRLEAGSYTLTVRDSKNATATAVAVVSEPDVYTIVSSDYIPDTGAPNTRTAGEGFISVQYDAGSRKTTFRLKAGFDLRPAVDGIWKLTVTSENPKDKELAGNYKAYFNACNHNLFVGLYRESYSGIPCKTDKRRDLKGKKYCSEGWLPEDTYAEIVKNIIIFANGYRKVEKLLDRVTFSEFHESNDLTETADIRNYWEGKDESFKQIRKPDVVYYADGHHSITTSSHNVNNDPVASQKGFLRSYYTSVNALEPTNMNSENIPMPNKCYLNASCVKFDVVPNLAGFNYRRAKGKKAAVDLLSRMAAIGRGSDTRVIYHIDMVAHSMGFAYAQGIIESLKISGIKDRIVWGGYYILAPENGSAGIVNVGNWEQIWQYGSDLDRPDKANADKMWEQDGVAPQSGVQGLPDGLRAYIPKNQNISKNFVDSHIIKNYGWIFNGTLKLGDAGYVIPK